MISISLSGLDFFLVTKNRGGVISCKAQASEVVGGERVQKYTTDGSGGCVVAVIQSHCCAQPPQAVVVSGDVLTFFRRSLNRFHLNTLVKRKDRLYCFWPVELMIGSMPF